VDLRGADAVVAVDIAPPASTLDVPYREVDLTEPAADQRLLDIFKEEGVETVVHLAFFTNPRRDSTYAHEFESIGTLNLLAAAAAAGVRRVLLRSFTAVYGARGKNSNFLTEDRALEPNPALSWARDKFEAEQHAASFARRYPGMTITVLRFAPVFGPGIHTFYTGIFDRRVVPVLLGYDPLLQLLHPEDALGAIEAALSRGPKGALNIVPKSPIPLLAALHLGRKIPVPVPHPIAYGASALLWSAALAEAPGAFLDYVRFPFVAEGEKARKEMGFSPRYSSREALLAYLRYRHPEALSRPLAAHA
jgi:UDP-glucose 4-epimerase